MSDRIDEHEEFADELTAILDEVPFTDLPTLNRRLDEARNQYLQHFINDYECEILARASRSVSDVLTKNGSTDTRKRGFALEDIGRVRKLSGFRAKKLN